jgi:hypothetical protein
MKRRYDFEYRSPVNMSGIMRKQLETELLFSDDARSGFSVFAEDDPGVDLGRVLEKVGCEMARRHGAGSQRTGDAAAQIRTSLHGNLSPAAIEFDEEEAVWFGAAGWTAVGDPALDLARLMGHLCVMSVHRGSCIMLSDIAGPLHAGYLRSVAPHEKRPLAYRAGPLTVAVVLELAGTAPYLQPQMREDLQEFAQFRLARRDYTLGQVWSVLSIWGSTTRRSIGAERPTGRPNGAGPTDRERSGPPA